jgi:MFS family permease
MSVTSEEMNDRIAPEGEDQLAWERRIGPQVGIAAGLAAIFMAASFIVQLPLLRDRTKNEADTLRSVHKHVSGYVFGGILQALALLLIAVVLWYLFRVTKYRRPQIPRIALILGIAGPLVFGLAGAIGPFVIKHYAAEFVNGANQTNQHAKDLVNGSSASVFSIITPAAGLAFAFAMIMTNVNGIRTGVLSTFAGVIGVIGGILFVLPLGPPQLLLFFWLLSVSLICLDRWPGGRGPAWASGEAMKWPTAMERRGMTAGGPRGPRQRRGRQPEPEPEPEREIALDEPVEGNQTRSSRKRKRKQGRKH